MTLPATHEEYTKIKKKFKVMENERELWVVMDYNGTPDEEGFIAVVDVPKSVVRFVFSRNILYITIYAQIRDMYDIVTVVMDTLNDIVDTQQKAKAEVML